MQMLGTLAEGNGVHPVTAGEVLNKTTGSPNHLPPVGGFRLVECERTGAMAQAVQKQPANQWCRIGVMTKHPEIGAFNFVAPDHDRITMQGADRTVGNEHPDDARVLN